MLGLIVTDALIERLDQVFPAKPTRAMPPREIDHQIGQQEVIDYIKRLAQEQRTEPLALEEV